MFKIMLDAGHGRNTAGKRCLASLDAKQTREWVLNSRICEKVEKFLQAYTGYAIKRADDVTGERDIPLRERTDAANQWGADLYLSVHHNAGIGGGTGGGIVAIVYTEPGEQSVRYQRIIYDSLVQHTGLKGNRVNPLLRQNLHVCRETAMPAVLVECGFMDSVTDVPIILTEHFADCAAEGICRAIVTIGNLKRKEEKVIKQEFADISQHYAERAIKDLQNMGVVNGVDQAHFAPNEYIKRGDVALIARNIIRYITGK